MYIFKLCDAAPLHHCIPACDCKRLFSSLWHQGLTHQCPRSILYEHPSAVVSKVADARRQSCHRPHREKSFLAVTGSWHKQFSFWKKKKQKKQFSLSTNARIVTLEQIIFKATPWGLVLPLTWIIVATGDHTWEREINGCLGHQWLMTKQVCTVWENKTMWRAQNVLLRAQQALGGSFDLCSH